MHVSTRAVLTAAAATLDEGAMDDLFREILAPSPLLSSAPLPLGVAGKVSAPAHAAVTPLAAPMIDWEGEAEMQRLLDMLPDVRPDMKAVENEQ